MPLFEFTCSKCGKVFEELLTLADLESAAVACPDCGSNDVQRGLSELRRVVSRTGTVLIYDPPGWFVRVESRGPEIERVIPGAPFGERELAGFASVAGVPFVKKATLRPAPPV